MRAFVLVPLLAWCSACTVALEDHAGRACDSEHPCLGGRVCVEGRCVTPEGTGGDGGTCESAQLGEVCEAGVGACARQGVLVCQNGVPTCDAVPGEPAPIETCDGVDNDCDGEVDNDLTPPDCKRGGVCGDPAPRTCLGEAGWSACEYGEGYEPEEASCDGLDNDCDGTVDDVPGCLYTLAGSGPAGFVDGKGNAARVALPGFLHPDGQGNLLLADTGNHAIRRISSTGEVTTIAGTGRCGFADGPAATARFCEPVAVVRGPDGALYVSDAKNHRIRRVFDGEVTTVAGTGMVGYADGPPHSAHFDYPMGLFVRDTGDLLIADSGNSRIRRLTLGSNSQVSTFAGAGWGTTEGSRTQVRFMGVADVVEADDGRLFVSEPSGSRIRELPDLGNSRTLVGSSGAWGYQEGIGTNARLSEPTQLHLDEQADLLYFVDGWNYRVRTASVAPFPPPTQTVGGATEWGYVNGALAQARAQYVSGFALVGGEIFFSDYNHAIRKTSGPLSGRTTSDFAAGSQGELTKDGPGSGARLRNPRGLVRGPDGSFYWVDYPAHLVRQLTPEGEVVTLIGSAAAPLEGSSTGPFSQARVSWPSGLAFGPDGMLYLADSGNCAIRRLDLETKQLTHFAGSTNGDCGHIGGSLTQARFDEPRALAFGKDAEGNDVMYVSDALNYVLRKIVLPSGPVSTIAGTPGSPGGTNGGVWVGRFGGMGPLAADDLGNVWVMDDGLPRRVSSDGVLSTPYKELPTFAEAVALDGDQLLVSGLNMILRMNAANPDPDSVQVIFEGPRGWQDGPNHEAGGGYYEALVVTPDAYYVADFLTGRIRQLWR